MRHVVLLAALCAGVAGACHAAANYPAAPRLSADRLISYCQEGALTGAAPDPAFLLNQRYAQGYLAGVADAAQGRQWCDTGRLKTLEIDALIVAELKQLSVRALSTQRPRS
ncbi:hypothetical protein KIV45_16810 [Janthinobacterium lividum]|nr:hypothetical protein KIV45_16810 [Janthinobacterium lividum]